MSLMICGLNGSGKSLLKVLCNSHPLVEVTEEFAEYDSVVSLHDRIGQFS